jgi:hypothetical protein
MYYTSKPSRRWSTRNSWSLIYEKRMRFLDICYKHPFTNCKFKQGLRGLAVLSQPGKKAQMYVDPCYTSHTWAFLDHIGSHIQLELTTWMRPQHIGNRFIMDDVAKLPGIKPIKLVHVQRVRLFLGVTTLADISSSDGKTLCNWVLPVYENPRKPVFRFPHQDDHRHQTSSQPGNRLFDRATHPKKLRNWNDPAAWDAGTKAASTKCGIPLLTQQVASSIYGLMDTYDCV